jgi:hypothetical protein
MQLVLVLIMILPSVILAGEGSEKPKGPSSRRSHGSGPRLVQFSQFQKVL